MHPPRKIVIDACVLFSFFNKDSARRRVLLGLVESGHKLISPDFALAELSGNAQRISAFAKISPKEFNDIMQELCVLIATVPVETYARLMPKAVEIKYSTGLSDQWSRGILLSRTT